MSEYDDQPVAPDPSMQRVLDGWQYILNNRQGRAVVRDLLRVCHYGISPFSGKDNDTTNMISGKQKVAEEIMSLMNAVNPNAFFLMSKEAREDDEHDRASNATEPGGGS